MNSKEQYATLIMNNDDFRAFVESMEKYSTKEIIALYGLENSLISYSVLLGKLT